MGRGRSRTWIVADRVLLAGIRRYRMIGVAIVLEHLTCASATSDLVTPLLYSRFADLGARRGPKTPSERWPFGYHCSMGGGASPANVIKEHPARSLYSKSRPQPPMRSTN